MKWKNLKLGRKFFVSFGVVITLLALIALIAINGINNLIDGADNIVERNTIQSDLEYKYVQHLQWAQEVNKLLTDENITELNVQTDHTKCAFGKWYYGEGRKGVEAKSPELKSLFDEFEEPHKHLHASAIEIKESFVQSDFKVGAKIREIKSDHLLWMHAIKDVLLSKGSKLDVQTDHLKCNMGKWLSSSEIIELRKKNLEFNALMAQVEEPHELLHESAIRIGNYVNARNYNEAYNYFYANTNEYAHETLDKLNKILAWQDANMEGMNKANEIYNNKTLKHLNDVGDLFTEVIEASKSMVSEINKTIVQKAFSTRTGVTIFSLAAIIIAIIFAIIITKGIVVPIRKSMQFAEEVSKGNLTTIIDIDQKDEVGQLSYALQVMIEKLKQIVETVKEGADNIASASQQMNSSSQQMSQGASEQASSAEEVSSSMEEMASNIQQNTDNAQQTEKIALVSADGIKVGSESTEISVKAMKEIAEKITIVNDIAFQTNILALNAAVEAARAGEYGKGFAVVAAEVRKLAERSKIAADEIDHLSKNGVGISEKAGEQLREIMPEIEKTAKLVQEIAAASLEQNSGADQVNSAIQQLNQVTQQNAATSEEMATSSEELASQAEQLMETISYFKTDTKSIKKNIAPIKNQSVITKQEDYQKSKGIDINLFEDKVSDVNYEKF